ncbi:MAG: endonuclease [Muribaculaceae bacterium]|nr:endonuclease [Muribaculaceae bacterium]
MKQIKSWFMAMAMGAAALPGALAEAPSGYYSTCEGKKGAALLSALCSKISSHTNVGYDGLWNVYQTSDVRSNGKIWDMYSTKEWTFSKEQCGNYKNVGDCYNREHSMPKSWFSEASPMKSDAYHIYPTDGKVNGQRSNYPYGECANGTTLPANGSVKALGRLGKSTFSGYSGTVFEPDDEYKGDFARTYFYMAACYNDKIGGWSSDMLAKNSYPVFTQWAIDLLLKWHRQDPVSTKETDRNEAVYAYQKNRNPFIDHPELAEHIWGNSKDTGWNQSATPQGAIATPVDGSTLDLGMCGINETATLTITVKGQNLTSAVAVTVSGSGFTASTTSIAAAQACSESGASLTLKYTSATAGTATGTLKLTSGDVSSTVSLKAETTADITALEAANVGETSFDARWVCVDKAGVKYTLNVMFNGQQTAGYPKSVEATDERSTVSGLTPGTTYTYSLTSPSGRESNIISVTTTAPEPSIQFLFDGDLYFSSKPGEPSDVAELLIDAENIADLITVSVTAPFELSSDKSAWTTDLPLDAEQNRFYMRMNSSVIGHFTTTLAAKAGSYTYDDIEVKGQCSDQSVFMETFEAPSELEGYNGGEFKGTACRWNVIGAYVGDDTRDVHTGLRALRFNKTEGSESRLEMAEPKEHGVGTVKFYGRAWGGEGGDIALEASTDGGITWNTVGRFTVGDSDWKQYSAEVNLPEYVRLRFSRVSGRRINIDDIEADDYAVNAVKELEYHTWDAYCLDGLLTIENSTEKPLVVTVNSPNGATWHSGLVAPGLTGLQLPAGVYLVTSGGFTRKVVVR